MICVIVQDMNSVFLGELSVDYSRWDDTIYLGRLGMAYGGQPGGKVRRIVLRTVQIMEGSLTGCFLIPKVSISICWKLRHTQYVISHLDEFGSDRQIVLYYDSDDDSV